MPSTLKVLSHRYPYGEVFALTLDMPINLNNQIIFKKIHYPSPTLLYPSLNGSGKALHAATTFFRQSSRRVTTQSCQIRSKESLLLLLLFLIIDTYLEARTNIYARLYV